MRLRSTARALPDRGARAVAHPLEPRRLLDGAFWDLSAGSLLQNWENTALLAQSNDWGAVPSVEGYVQDSGSGTNRNPQLILTDTGTTLNLTPNLTSGNVSNGGVLEIQGGTQLPIGSSGSATVGLQPTNAFTDPYLRLNLNNSGRAVPVRIKYDLIDIDATTATPGQNPIQSFALQYRLATSGSYTNVPAGYVENAADALSGAVGLTHSLDVTLPNDTIGAPVVQIRIMTTNAEGSDQMVAVDNLRVFGSDVFAFQPATYTLSESAGTFQLIVKRLGDLNGTASVNFAVSGGTATVPEDVFMATSGTLTFGNGVESQTITATVINDTDAEPTESFTVSLNSPSAGFTLGANSVATVSINDNDTALPSVVLNEIKIDPPDADTAAEYVELRATPGLSLANLYFVSIEGDGTISGLADLVVDLTQASIGSSGYLLIGAPGTTVPSGTTLVTDADFGLVNGVLESGSNTFALIYALTPLVEGTDLDTNNDGALELAAGSVVIDAIAASDGGTTDETYGPVLEPPTGTYHAATRKLSNQTAQDAGAWYSGNLIDPSLGVASETGIYDPNAGGGLNVPMGAVLTPGAENYSTGAGAGAFVLIPITRTVEETVGTISFQVYRAGGAAGAASITVSATGGTANAGSDYLFDTQVLNFTSGEFKKTFSITIINDTISEAAETITVQLADPLGATLLREGTGSVTINLSDPAAPTRLLLNELNLNPPGTDQPYEYVELRGTPGTQLVNVYLFSIEGSLPGAGILRQVVDLTGAIIGNNGLLLIKSSLGGFVPEDTRTSVFATAQFDGIENDSTTVMLVFIADGVDVPAEGIDLDPGNTGALDLATGISTLDSVATLDPDVGDRGYGLAVLAPITDMANDAADALVRFAGDNRPSTAAAWYCGNLLSTNSVQTQKNFSPTNISTNFPAGGVLTPGASNLPGDTAAPTVVSGVFTFLTQAGEQQRFTVTFSEDVGESLTEADFTLININANTVVPLTLAGIDLDGRVATFTFRDTGNALGSSILADGHYRLRVSGGQVADPAGNVLAADYDSTFAFKNADFDGDFDVDFDNLLTLAQNFGGSGKSFAQGDVNYDGTVNFDDLLALAQLFGTSLFGAVPISNAGRSIIRRSNDVLA